MNQDIFVTCYVWCDVIRFSSHLLMCGDDELVEIADVSANNYTNGFNAYFGEANYRLRFWRYTILGSPISVKLLLVSNHDDLFWSLHTLPNKMFETMLLLFSPIYYLFRSLSKFGWKFFTTNEFSRTDIIFRVVLENKRCGLANSKLSFWAYF